MPTDFPNRGDDLAVSMRNSKHPRFTDVAYAEKVRTDKPDIWAKGKSKRHDPAQFEVLARVYRQGGVPHTNAEETAVRAREAWGDKHGEDETAKGAVQQMQWLMIGSLGESGMKKTMTMEVADEGGRNHPATGGAPGAGSGGGHARLSPGAPAEPDDGLHLRAAIVSDVREEAREIDFVASTEHVDNHGSILRCNWRLKRFQTNNPLLWMHGRMNDYPAVGNVINVRVDQANKQLLGTAKFDVGDLEDKIFGKYVRKVLKGFSVGFDPGRVTIEIVDGEEVIVFDDNELLEVSCANVPSNPETLAKFAAQRARDLARARALLDANIRGAIPFVSYPPVEGGGWDGGGAEKRMLAWATKENGETDWAMYGKGFTWVDPEKKEQAGGYKLPHHDIKDDKLVTVRAGVIAAGNAVQGSRGGTKIPDADLPGVRKHLEQHYHQFKDDDGKPLLAPWEKEKAAPTPTERNMSLKKITHVRATGDGTCAVNCPNCKEDYELDLEVNPIATKKAAESAELRVIIAKHGEELTAAKGEVAKRDAEIAKRDGDLTKKDGEIAEQRALVEAGKARLNALEGSNTQLMGDLLDMRLTGAKRDLEALVGTRIFPTQLDAEMDIAKLMLGKTDRTADGKMQGDLDWAKRLDVLRKGADLGMLGRGIPPAAPANAGGQGGARPAGGVPPNIIPPGAGAEDSEGRTTSGAGLANLVAASATKQLVDAEVRPS